jgi:hypothetical protein
MLRLINSTWFRTALVIVYVLIGIGTNTAPPHYPTWNAPFSGGMIAHSFVQYGISIMLWPFSHWQPTFTVGKWTGL